MRRKNFNAGPYILPLPVLVIGTYDSLGTPNAMTACWGGIVDDKRICIGLSTHKSTENLLASGAFSINIGTESTVTSCDYVGLISALEIPDKFEKAGFHAIQSEHIKAPIIKEFPFALECKVLSYENEILWGEIVNISADESIVTDGSIDISKLHPIVCDPIKNEYYSLGKKIGNAFQDGWALAK